MKLQLAFISAVIQAAGILVTPDNICDGNSTNPSELRFDNCKRIAFKPNRPMEVKASWKMAVGSDTLPPNHSRKISPESVPWLVKIQTMNGYHMFTGALITWQKVVTTCNAATSEQTAYVSAGFGRMNNQKRRVISTTVDKRYSRLNSETVDRYCVGIIIVNKPFIAGHSLNVVQFPTLNKRKFLELTDQLTARVTTHCKFYQWNNNGVLKSITVTAVEPYRLPICHEVLGLHEFICSISSTPINDDSDTAEGTPIICGEDIYGILLDAFGHPLQDTATNRTIYVWLRLDEFVHLVVGGDPGLEHFIKYVQY